MVSTINHPLAAALVRTYRDQIHVIHLSQDGENLKAEVALLPTDTRLTLMRLHLKEGHQLLYLPARASQAGLIHAFRQKVNSVYEEELPGQGMDLMADLLLEMSLAQKACRSQVLWQTEGDSGWESAPFGDLAAIWKTHPVSARERLMDTPYWRAMRARRDRTLRFRFRNDLPVLAEMPWYEE